MRKSSFYAVFVLTILWIVLCESFTLQNLLLGFAVSVFCTYAGHRLFPSPFAVRVNIPRLLYYLCYLVMEIYLAGFTVIRNIISGEANVGVVRIRTRLNHDFLRVVLANSITLTPGTISLDVEEDTITVLWLNCTDTDPETAGSLIKGNLEKMLLKVQR